MHQKLTCHVAAFLNEEVQAALRTSMRDGPQSLLGMKIPLICPVFVFVHSICCHRCGNSTNGIHTPVRVNDTQYESCDAVRVCPATITR